LLLEIKGLTVYYGKALALSSVDLKVAKGELVAVIGPNGAGKSTLLRTISGIIKPAVGSIYYNGREISNMAPHLIARQGIVHCPEGRRPFAGLTVYENLQLGGLFAGSQDEFGRRLEYVYGLFPILKERAKQLAGTMSGGQQQMLAIGRALMARPDLLLLDEPSVGLAPKVVEEIFERVKQIRESGVTILLVEQNVEIALEVADHISILDHGRVEFKGTSQTLLDDRHLKEVYLGIA
jgi:branched-chain amino acid transport system ATP-binding protein